MTKALSLEGLYRSIDLLDHSFKSRPETLFGAKLKSQWKSLSSLSRGLMELFKSPESSASSSSMSCSLVVSPPQDLIQLVLSKHRRVIIHNGNVALHICRPFLLPLHRKLLMSNPFLSHNFCTITADLSSSSSPPAVVHQLSQSRAGLVTNSILSCWLFKIKDWGIKVRFQQTRNQGLSQRLLTVSWDLRA